MRRINVYDDEGALGWFDLDKSEWWMTDEGRLRDAGQDLGRTAGGRWVLETWSKWENTPTTYRWVTPQQAREWMLDRGLDEDAAQEFGPVEPERGPGRPEIGAPVQVRLGEELLLAVDQYAVRQQLSRAAAVRELVQAALDQAPS